MEDDNWWQGWQQHKDKLDHPETGQQHNDWPHTCTEYWKCGRGDEGGKLKDAGKSEEKVTNEGASGMDVDDGEQRRAT